MTVLMLGLDDKTILIVYPIKCYDENKLIAVDSFFINIDRIG